MMMIKLNLPRGLRTMWATDAHHVYGFSIYEENVHERAYSSLIKLRHNATEEDLAQ